MRRPCPVRRAVAALPLVVALALAPAPSDALIARVSTVPPPGWPAAVVPRAAADVTDSLVVTPSEQLRTDQPTWFEWTSRGNQAAGGGWTDALYLDGALVSLVGRPLDPRWIEHRFFTLNDGPVWVRGGRHMLALHADLYGIYLDGPGDLSDDYVTVSYLWPPMPATWGVPAGGPSPPSRASVHSYPAGPTASCEARSLTRPGVFPWVLAATGPGHPRLILYDDFVNSTTGLSHELGRVTPSGDSLDFLVGSGDPGPATVYPAVQRDDADTPGGYVLSSADASGRAGIASSEWPSVSLPPQTVAQVFRVTLTAGQPVPVSLTRFMGTADLAFALFAPGTGEVSSLRDALAHSAPHQDQEYDVLWFEPPVTGDYPLVVYRTTRAGIEQASGCALALGSHAVAVAAPGAMPLGLAIGSAIPARGPVRFALALPGPGRARLEVFDAAGRRVRALLDGELPGGRHEAAWDGRDDTGAPAGPGLFWVRLAHHGRAVTRRVVTLR